HCQTQLGLLVPDDAFDDLSQTFLWFLGRISVTAQDRVLRLMGCVVLNFKPGDLPDGWPDVALKDAFGDQPLPDNLALKTLDRLLIDSIPSAFYPSDASLLRDLDQTLQAVVTKILR